MPEGPEVERARCMVHSTFLNACITRVLTTPDEIVFDGCDPDEFAKHLVNKRLLNTIRKGKMFYLLLDQPPYPLLHLGMTGSVLVSPCQQTQKEIQGQQPPKFVDFKSDGEHWPPRFWKFVLDFDNGESMAFTDCRRLGRVRLQMNPAKESPMKELGFDPITETVPFEEFKCRIQLKSCPIKALFLDQSFSAGIGNWTADEILYQSAVHPARKCNSLSDDEISVLYDKMHFIMRKAVEWNADSDQFPLDWWSKGSKKRPVMPSGHAVVFETVGGRTSAIVPAIQKMNTASSSQKKSPSESEDSSSKQKVPRRKIKSENETLYTTKRQKQSATPTRRSTRITSKYFNSSQES